MSPADQRTHSWSNTKPHVNEFLAAMMSARDFQVMDRLPTAEKYVVGTQLALGRPLFERGKQPVQGIAALFKLRDKLVHPKAGYGPPKSSLDAASEPETTFTTVNAARHILYVSWAAIELVKAADPDGLDIPAHIVYPARRTLLQYASGGLPDPTDEPVRPLYEQLVRSFSEPEEADEEP